MRRKRRRGNGEGTIFEDKKNKRWIGQYISGTSAEGKAIRKSVYGKTQKEVLNKLNEIKYKMCILKKMDRISKNYGRYKRRKIGI